MSPIVSGCRNRLRRNLLHADAIVIDSRNTSMFPTLLNSRLKTPHACIWTVVILTILFKDASVVEKGLVALVPREKLPPQLLAHLTHTVVRDVADRPM